MLQNIDNYMVNGVEFKIEKNVKSVKINIESNEKTYEYYNSTKSDSYTNIFFLFETDQHAAFAHWINECCVFLPYFKDFIDAKLLIKQNPPRKYKKLFTKLFDIPDEKIIYLNNSNLYDYCYSDIPINNICIVCPNIASQSLNGNIMISEIFIGLIEQLKQKIFDINEISNNKTIEHLFLPRNNVENYQPNDRIINYTNVYNILKDKEHIKYNTMDTDDFLTQIQLLSSAKNIYLDYGSSFYVNGLFCTNSKIYISDYNHWQVENYRCNQLLVSLINKNNEIIIL